MWTASVKKATVLDLAYAPDSRTLFTLDDSGQVTRWDLASREPTALFEVDATCFDEECRARLAVSPDGRYVLATDEEKIAVWDLKTRKARKPIDCNDGSITYPCFADRGRELWTVGVAANWLIRWSWPGLKQLDKPAALEEMTEFSFAVAADPTGVRLSVFDSANSVVVWDLPKDRLLMTVEVDAGDFDDVPMAFTPGGETFVVGHKKTIHLSDPDEGKVVQTLALKGGAVWRLAFHPAGRLFASAGASAVVTFWDAENGRSVQTWEMPFKKVHSLAFSPDGCTCAAGGVGGKFVVWDVGEEQV
jgi:WD40 repeat protein